MSKIIIHFNDNKQNITIVNYDIDLSKVDTITKWWKVQNPKQRNSELLINMEQVKYCEIIKEEK